MSNRPPENAEHTIKTRHDTSTHAMLSKRVASPSLRRVSVCVVALVALSVSSTSAFVIPSRVRSFSSQLFGRRAKGKVDKRPSKSNLPEKICVVCGRPFTWRKKWERCWDEVTCCSKSCNAKRRAGVPYDIP
jgi:hypothetical protein